MTKIYFGSTSKFLKTLKILESAEHIDIGSELSEIFPKAKMAVSEHIKVEPSIEKRSPGYRDGGEKLYR